MFVGCYMCGTITNDDMLSITQYGLLPICAAKCLREINASTDMPPRVKTIYKQQSSQSDPCLDCHNDKCNSCENKINVLINQAI